MYRIGQEEIDAVAAVIHSGKMFRYHEGGQCHRFEQRYGKFLGVEHVAMTASGTNALTAALAGLGIGPGDEVIVPSFTYMATAIAVLGVGAIPIIVDVDESTCLSPEAVADAVGPRTRAMIPVHMWGQPCDMNALMKVARKHKLLVCEDACQAVGGGYEGQMLGTFGNVGSFSFNYFKNMTAGEGGCVVSDDEDIMTRVRCMIDPCSFYWKGRSESFTPFVANGARASEFEGAILNVQLDRIKGMVKTMRSQKKKILKAVEKTPLTASPVHSLDHECGTHVMFLLPTAAQAEKFRSITGGTIAGQTGRHVYTEWDSIFAHQGAHHDALNPFKLKENKSCRTTYKLDQCAASLDILNRTVMLGNHPDHTADDVKAKIKMIKDAAKEVFAEEPSAAK